MEQHRDQHPKARTLPAVIPLVVHSNSTGHPWTAPTEISDLIDLDPATREVLRPHLPRLRFLLDDIAAIGLSALRARDLTPATRVMLALHKIAPRNTDLGSDMLKLVDDLRALSAGPHPVSELQAVMTYILIVGETTENDLDPLIEQLGPRAKEAIVTTAERLRAEGRAATLIELLTVKFGSVPETTIRTIRAAAPDSVDIWLHRLITAGTLDQVFQ
ncbi:Rpn family recombination-promoting nuclease/putative transposase [Nocardia zapadnayensis]|uniref:Rpn family recombination-promoting nuclease/putative transposase n=1 Tax=Nocardia rhamnosiphila TaxID=426716 RepID=UPI0022483955|nr:Rpn family recombination-promoting nuclease/putative transposase [Nocardia zapadnayensis]MCX0272402.1 Rpn family recombination-promoting nuclease/putative transposase [Nocardia zapadnayensis]